MRLSTYYLTVLSFLAPLLGCSEQKNGAAVIGAGPSAARPQTIFDGKTLKGWKEVGGGKWSVADGQIIGENGDGRFGWLVYEEPVADFNLEFECKHDAAGNSGVQFRSHLFGDEMVGYQAEFDPRPDHGTGGIYEQGGRGWLKKPDEKGLAAMKPMEWNTYRISATGDHLQTWVNGTQTIDMHDPQARSGIIALQVHCGDAPVKVRWRNVRLITRGDCGESASKTGCWKPLFNGKDLDGWHTQGEPDCWRVADGVITGELSKPSPYAYLATDKKYDNFELKLQMIFDSENGNSGLFFRCSFPPHCAKCNEVARDLPEDVKDFKCPKCGSTETLPMSKRVHIHGPQSEFAPAKDTGSPTAAIYDARGHGWINLDKIDKRMRQMNHMHEWNELRLIADGNHIVTYLNGYLISDISDYDFPKTGIIALQLHTGDAMKVRFKDIVIRPLPVK